MAFARMSLARVRAALLSLFLHFAGPARTYQFIARQGEIIWRRLRRKGDAHWNARVTGSTLLRASCCCGEIPNTYHLHTRTVLWIQNIFTLFRRSLREIDDNYPCDELFLIFLLKIFNSASARETLYGCKYTVGKFVLNLHIAYTK